MTVAQFRINQGASLGTPGRSRHDLVPGTVVTLVATAPLGAGITYAWEILDKIGSVAALTSTSGTTVNIGSSGGQLVAPCAFRVKLTVNDNGIITSTIRICSILTPNTGLRVPLFSESAPSTNTLNANDPNTSEDNAVYTDRAGLGVTDQNWRGWSEWAYTLTIVVDDIAAGAVSLGGDLSGVANSAEVVGLLGHPFFGTPGNNNAIFYDNGAHRWYFAAISADPTLGGDLSGVASSATVIGIEDFPILGSPDPTKVQYLITQATGDPPAVTSWAYASIPTTPGFSNVLYVDPTRGDNATAIRGDFSKPYSTVAGALAAMQDGDFAHLSPGVHVVNGSALAPPGGVTHFGIMGYARGDVFSSLIGASEVVSTQLLCNGIDLLHLDKTIDGCFLANLTLRVIGAGFKGIRADASAGTGTSMQAGLILNNVKIEAEIPFDLNDITLAEFHNSQFVQSGGSTNSQIKNVSICILSGCFGLFDVTVWWDNSDSAKPVTGRNGASFAGTSTNGTLIAKGQPYILGDAASSVQYMRGDTLTVVGGKAIVVSWKGQIGDDGGGNGTIDFGTSGTTQIPDSNIPEFNFSGALLNGAGNNNITFAMGGSPVNAVIVNMRGAILSGDKSGTARTITAGPGVTIDIENADIRYFDFLFASSGNGSFSNVISTTSAANLNDLDLNNPFGQEAASTIRINTTANINLTGLARGYPNSRKWIFNVGTFNLTLKDASGSSSAVNQFAIGSDLVIPAKRGIEVVYDGVTTRWRVVGTISSAGGAVGPSNAVYVDVAGSDSTGTRGDASKPFLTFRAALAATHNKDEIILGPGFFDETAGGAYMSPPVAVTQLIIRGSGRAPRDAATLFTTVAGTTIRHASDSVLSFPNTQVQVIIKDLTIKAAATGIIVDGAGGGGTVLQMGLILENCTIQGNSAPLDINYATIVELHDVELVTGNTSHLLTCSHVRLVDVYTNGSLDFQWDQSSANKPLTGRFPYDLDGVQVEGAIQLASQPSVVASASCITDQITASGLSTNGGLTIDFHWHGQVGTPGAGGNSGKIFDNATSLVDVAGNVLDFKNARLYGAADIYIQQTAGVHPNTFDFQGATFGTDTAATRTLTTGAGVELDLTGAVLSPGMLFAQAAGVGNAHLGMNLTPAQITGDHNDYAPTGWDKYPRLLLDFDADGHKITGIGDSGNAGNKFDGLERILVNTSAFYAVLTAEDSGSVAGNRFGFTSDIVLKPKMAVRIFYSRPAAGLAGRWRTDVVDPAEIVITDHNGASVSVDYGKMDWETLSYAAGDITFAFSGTAFTHGRILGLLQKIDTGTHKVTLTCPTGKKINNGTTNTDLDLPNSTSTSQPAWTISQDASGNLYVA